MRSLFIAPNDSVYMVEMESIYTTQELIGNYDLIVLDNGLLMAVNGIGAQLRHAPNPLATLFLADILNVVVPIAGNAIVSSALNADLDPKDFPDWVQHAIAAPMN